jgi:hypothetical protein
MQRNEPPAEGPLPASTPGERGQVMPFSEIINRIIALATAIREHWHEEAPKHYPNFPWIRLDEDPLPPPPQREELRTLLLGLSPAKGPPM